MTVVNITKAEPELVKLKDVPFGNYVQLGPREGDRVANRIAMYLLINSDPILIFIDKLNVVTLESGKLYDLLVYVIVRLDITAALRR